MTPPPTTAPIALAAIHLSKLQFGMGGLTDTAIPTTTHAANIPRPPAMPYGSQRSNRPPAHGERNAAMNTGQKSGSQLFTVVLMLMYSRIRRMPSPACVEGIISDR